MKLHILGTASGLPELNKHHAAVMINYENKKILIDAGEGISQQLLKYNYDKDYIDDIIITHFHPDHVSGIFLLLQMLYLQERKKELRIFIPEKCDIFLNTVELFYLFPQKFKFKLSLFPIVQLAKFHPEIIIISNAHLEKYKNIPHQIHHSYKNYSIYLKTKKKILYTSDIPDFSSLQDYWSKADLIILDALHPDSKDIKKHISETNARVILNHGVPKEFKNEKFENADETKPIIF